MTFRLRFSVRDIAGYAAAYPADDDRVAETDVAPAAKAAGTLSKSNPTNCLGTNFSLHACVKTAAACRDFSFGLYFVFSDASLSRASSIFRGLSGLQMISLTRSFLMLREEAARRAQADLRLKPKDAPGS